MTIDIDGEDYELVGDVYLHPSQRAAWDELVVPDQAGTDELTAMTVGGLVARWKPERVLSYAVERATFPDDVSYATVKALVEPAARAWMDACGVCFEHHEVHDQAADAAQHVVFTVRYQKLPRAQLAAAFFPGEHQAKRHLFIDPKWFTTSFTREGILRHELGHILGFRHEHIRLAAAAAALGIETTTDSYDLTAYDGLSVMHYVNQQYGNQELVISELDRLGAQRIYGLPLAQLRYVD